MTSNQFLKIIEQYGVDIVYLNESERYINRLEKRINLFKKEFKDKVLNELWKMF